MGQTLLVGIDGSKGALRALEFAATRANSTGESLLIAYVIEWSPFSFSTPGENETRHQRREAELDRAESEIVMPLVEQYREQGVETAGMVRHGHAASTLNEIAAEEDASVIFVGRTGDSRLKAILFGSVVGSLVQIADRPVTVVP